MCAGKPQRWPQSSASAAAFSRTSTDRGRWPRFSKRLRRWSPPRWKALPAGARSPTERRWEFARKEPHSLRIVHAEIPSRSGPALGTLYAGFDPKKPPDRRARSRRSTTARGWPRWPSKPAGSTADLRRRSEYDLLTDIPNRFAMEKFMDLQIEEARLSGRILGLIYIDLDKFKPINDTYGHHVGDLYLQAVALRMSRQLLGSDMLARLGGDEFAALVSLHHGRSDLEKIVTGSKAASTSPSSSKEFCSWRGQHRRCASSRRTAPPKTACSAPPTPPCTP